MVMVIPNEAEKNILDDFVIDHTLDLRLYTDVSFIPTADTVLGDFTEATFSGYASENLSFDPSSTVANNADSTAVTVTFQPDTTVSETCYGYYITYQNAAMSDVLFGAEAFAEPVYFTGPADQKPIQVNLTCNDKNQ